MLVELRIRNVAVIDHVALPLAEGLNVLTGETGAGKSLIVGALGLLLGERAAADRVRAGAERATVEGIFEIAPGAAIRSYLDERGIEAEDGSLVLKREVAANGRSRGWINATPVTATVLADIGARLVSIHGQHDSRQLVEADHQRELLDAFAGALPQRANVEAAFDRVTNLRRREQELEARRQDAERRADYLRFVAREIDDAALHDGEEDALDADIARLANAEELQLLAGHAVELLGSDDGAAGAVLGNVRRLLAQIARIDATTDRWRATLDGAVYALDELARDIDAYGADVEGDPDRLRALEKRRDLVSALVRKYGPSIPDVLRVGRDARAELDLVDHGAADLSTLVSERLAAEAEFDAACAILTALRADASTRISTAVTALLPDLGMPNGRFSAILTPSTPTRHGAEQIQFAAALNAGTDARPLARIASGGELARVMLALSTVIARLQQVPTLVFDEVDAGIGGAVAWQVGTLMRQVAGHHQVLAISHLAQIAARAHRHVSVRKGGSDAVTSADTSVLEREDRVMEIARMLGGDADREVSRAHARELLERGAQAVARPSDASPGAAAASDAATSSRKRDDGRTPNRRGQRLGKPV